MDATLNVVGRKAFHEHDWDIEIDNLLNAIVRNDSDKDVITSLSDTASHHSPDDSLSIQDDDSLEDQNSLPCHIIGIHDITNTWNTGFQLMPDFTFQLYDSYIYATPNHQRSRIVSKVTFHGTKVFNLLNDLPYLSSLLTSSSSSSLENYQQLPQVKSILDLVRNSIGTQNLQQIVQLFNKSPSNDNVMQTDTMKEQPQINDENHSFSSTTNNPLLDNYQIFNLMSCFQQLSLLSKPIHYTIEGILTTFLDESNRILRFQFDCSKLQPDLL
eukprot:gene1675-1773_t